MSHILSPKIIFLLSGSKRLKIHDIHTWLRAWNLYIRAMYALSPSLSLVAFTLSESYRLSYSHVGWHRSVILRLGTIMKVLFVPEWLIIRAPLGILLTKNCTLLT